ncbi:MAG: toprim domain-containing protein [Lentibacter sp.]
MRLSEAHEQLVVCEGVETGLSLSRGLLGGPAAVWAALSTSGMRRLSLPLQAGQLTIASDGDTAGREAANALAARADALGWRVTLMPAPEGLDWNDVLMMKGEAA